MLLALAVSAAVLMTDAEVMLVACSRVLYSAEPLMLSVARHATNDALRVKSANTNSKASVQFIKAFTL